MVNIPQVRSLLHSTMPSPTTNTDTEASTFMLRGSSIQNLQPNQSDRRKLQGSTTADNKNPLYPTKDAAERPFDPESFFKGSESFQERPSSISYFPDQVIQLTYMVSVRKPTAALTNGNSASNKQSLSNSLYLEDLKEALDILATEVAPQAYPNLWVRELTTSVDGWFAAGECVGGGHRSSRGV
jgi:hypothetical protein